MCSLWLRRLVLAALLVVLLATGRTALALAINIDFGSANPAPSSAFGAASGEVGVWNNIDEMGPSFPLVDTAGDPSGASISVLMGGMIGFGEGGGSLDANLLMTDNFFIGAGNSWSFTISGLPDGLYDVYLYEPSNTVVGTGNGTVNGDAFANINGGFSGGVFSEGSNYHRLEAVLVTGGLLNGTGTDPSGFSGLAGLQLVSAVPEPASLTLLAAGIGLLATLRRRR
jgi:hypothetical protein